MSSYRGPASGNTGELFSTWHDRDPVRRLSTSNSMHSEPATISIELGIRGPWLKGDWVRFFERHGWQVTCRTVIANSPDLIQTPRELLAPAYRDAPASDFDSLMTHFVAKRRN